LHGADPNLDYAANFAHMLGFQDDIMHELMRLYISIHRLCSGSVLKEIKLPLSTGPVSILEFSKMKIMWKEIPPYHGWYLSDVDALVAVIMREGM
jgi:hypothetical protein